MLDSLLGLLGTLAAFGGVTIQVRTRAILWGHGRRGSRTTTVGAAMLSDTAERTKKVLIAVTRIKDNESGPDHRVIGAIPKVGVKMTVSPAGQEDLGLRETRRRAQPGTAGLGNGGELNKRLRDGAVNIRLRHKVTEVSNGVTGYRLHKQKIRQSRQKLPNPSPMIGTRYVQRISERSMRHRAPVGVGRPRRHRPPQRFATR